MYELTHEKNRNIGSIFGKILSDSKVSIVYQNVRTAYIDLKERVIVLPLMDSYKLTPDQIRVIYGGMIPHEVGHERYTPAEGYHTTQTEVNGGRKFGFILNVLEDVRIEKKMKRQFPGVRSSLCDAYKLLWEMDFFGVKKLKDSSVLNLIDRINLYSKVGSHIRVEFPNKIEQDFATRAATTESFDEVAALAKDIHKYIKDNEQDKVQSKTDLQKEIKDQNDPKKQAEKAQKKSSQDEKNKKDKEEKSRKARSDEHSDKDESDSDDAGDDAGDDASESEESDDAGDDAGKSGDESDCDDSDAGGECDGDDSDAGDGDSDGADADDSDDSEASGKKQPEGKGSDGSDNHDNEEVASVTDQINREKMESITDPNGHICNSTLPAACLDSIVVPMKTLYTHAERMTKRNTNRNFEASSAACLKYLIDRNKNYINHLLKEFEMRKDAGQYLRAKSHRSGELDMRKLARYKFTNDIFRRITEMPKGKNHAILMFVDMSSSMIGEYTASSVEQTIVFSMFCAKAGIPFEVYGFSDDNSVIGGRRMASAADSFSTLPSDLLIPKGFRLLQLLNSAEPFGLQQRAMRFLALWASGQSQEQDFSRLADGIKVPNDSGFDLNGTPLSQAIIASRQVVENFKIKTRADVITSIWLTDGDGNGGIAARDAKDHHDKIMLTDPVTKQQLLVNNMFELQHALTRFVGMITGCRQIGFYICRQQYLDQLVNQRYDKSVTQEQIDSAKNHGFVAKPTSGYDNYYYITNRLTHTSETIKAFELQEYKAGGRALLNRFSDMQAAKKDMRVILSKVSEEIAKQL